MKNNVVTKSGQHAMLSTYVSSGGWWPFSTFDEKSSSSARIYICITLVSIHSMHVLWSKGVNSLGTLYESPSMCIFSSLHS